MVTIPRYEGSLGSAPIRSGRNLSTGISGATSFTEFGQNLAEGLNSFNKTKIELTAKIRDQEIRNRGLLAGAEFSNWLTDTQERYAKRDDYEMFGSLYEKDLEKIKKSIFH